MSGRSTNHALTAIALLLTTALASDDLFAQQKPASILVREVTSVEVTFEKSNPPNLLVRAKGMVTTAGHSNPRLEAVVYVMPPIDGLQDVNFYVDPPPPGRVVAQVLTEIETPVLRIERIPDWMKGVRVHAQNNTIEKR